MRTFRQQRNRLFFMSGISHSSNPYNRWDWDRKSPSTCSVLLCIVLAAAYLKYCKGTNFRSYGTWFRSFVLLKKVRNLIPDKNLFLSWGHWISMKFCFEALESTKISSYEPVSSQKYENGYWTKICNFTVSVMSLVVLAEQSFSIERLLKHIIFYSTYRLRWSEIKAVKERYGLPMTQNNSKRVKLGKSRVFKRFSTSTFHQ